MICIRRYHVYTYARYIATYRRQTYRHVYAERHVALRRADTIIITLTLDTLCRRHAVTFFADAAAATLIRYFAAADDVAALLLLL